MIDLLNIYIVSEDEDNDTFTSSFSDTNNTLKEHTFNNSDNADKNISFYFYKGKCALKMNIKDKNCIISAMMIKKQTAAAVKLKLKIVLKLKAKFKIKLVK